MTQKKPIIGITPSHNTENNDTSLRPTYPKAIAAAGGLPILLPLECSDEDIKQFMDVCDLWRVLCNGFPGCHIHP